MHGSPETYCNCVKEGTAESVDGGDDDDGGNSTSRFHLELADGDGLVGAGDADEGVDRLLRRPRHGGRSAAAAPVLGLPGDEAGWGGVGGGREVWRKRREIGRAHV